MNKIVQNQKLNNLMTVQFPTEETIAAISTAIAPGEGGIAVIRISGPDAIKAGKSIISIKGNNDWESHRILYGHVMDKTQRKKIDEVLVLIMKAPRSFTGEETIEIHCHGGLIPVQRVMSRVLENPNVRRALPGEFSQRAVINGRIELTQAESISELVGARSVKAGEIAMNGLDGGIQKRMESLRKSLLSQLSEIEARIDFEDEMPPLNKAETLNEFLVIHSNLKKLISDSDRANYLRQGIKVALIGCPNVGKSSLLNLLSRREKAIVTHIPGTTRDTLESQIILEGVPITLIDTAGIRKTENEIEKIGIARSHKVLETADASIMVFDLSNGWREEDKELLKSIPNDIPLIIVGNKIDIRSKSSNALDDFRLKKKFEYAEISALNGSGEKELVSKLLGLFNVCDTQGLEIALNERQKELASKAAEALEQIQEIARQDLPWDFWTIDLREAIHKLGELTGDEITEPLLDEIFSRFCIGK